MQFADSPRFMARSLSNLVNLSKGIRRIKCKYGQDDKNCGTCRIKYNYCDCFLKCTNFEVDFCLCCNKNYPYNFDKKLKKLFFNTYKFLTTAIIRFFLLFEKNVYPYEYMDNWERFNQTSLPKKEDFYSHLNMEDISDADYAQAKRVCKDFEIKN